MKSTEVKEALMYAVDIKKPAFVWGPPGIGKSDVVAQVAGEHNKSLIDVRAILLDPVDLRGIPQITDNGTTRFCPPSFLPYGQDEGILFFDELNAATMSVQASCYQLVLDRRLGEYVLPDGWIVVAAGNRETDRAVTHRMPTALANRFIHINFDVDLDDWVKWALNANVSTEVISFIRFRPDLLHMFDPQKNEKAFPTPRTWDMVSRFVNSGVSMDNGVAYEFISGIVGGGASSEFMAFMKIYKHLPSPETILLSPDTVAVPDDPSALYALCGALAKKISENNIDRIAKYAYRMPREFSVLLITDGCRKNPAIQKTRTYIEWTSKFSDLMV